MEHNYLHGDKSPKINALLAAAGWSFKEMMKKLNADFKNLFFLDDRKSSTSFSLKCEIELIRIDYYQYFA